MFRRRTDQVYSTLQQVQRRITEQTGGNQAQLDELRQEHGVPVASPNPAAPSVPGVNLQPLAQILPQQQVAPLPAPSLSPLIGQGGKRYVLQLSGEMAMLLMVVWLVSMALMFYFAQLWKSPSVGGVAAPVAEASGLGSAKRQGDHLLLLQSTPNATVDEEKKYQDKAAQLNEFMAKNANRGWKPYFGVLKPKKSGGLHLVFGVVEGTPGIAKEDFLAFAELLAKPQGQGGGGFGSASWVDLGQY
jgi:hypothetical protein